MRWDASVAMYPCLCSRVVWFQESPAMSDDQFDDALLITPASPEIIAKGLEADGYQLGISAFTLGLSPRPWSVSSDHMRTFHQLCLPPAIGHR